MKQKTFTVKLKEQEIDDILSALGDMKNAYEKEKKKPHLMAKNNPNMMKAIERLNKKFWKIIRSK